MPSPHHAYWDRLPFGFENLARRYDGALPTFGPLGRRVRRQRRGFGYALGNSFRHFIQLGRAKIGSPRFWVLLRRGGIAALLPVVFMAGIIGLTYLVFHTRAPLAVGAWIAYMVGSSVYSNARRNELQEWPRFAMRMRRQAVLSGTPRCCALHTEASGSQSPQQLAAFVARRRERWLKRLADVDFAERQALTLLEYSWLGFIPFVMVLPLFMGVWKIGPRLLMLTPVAIGGMYLALFGLPFVLGRIIVKRLARSITEHTCPDCRYPLADFATGEWRGHPIPNLGPRRCPECGAPWLLLPPPPPGAKKTTPYRSFRLFRGPSR